MQDVWLAAVDFANQKSRPSLIYLLLDHVHVEQRCKMVFMQLLDSM